MRPKLRHFAFVDPGSEPPFDPIDVTLSIDSSRPLESPVRIAVACEFEGSDGLHFLSLEIAFPIGDQRALLPPQQLPGDDGVWTWRGEIAFSTTLVGRHHVRLILDGEAVASLPLDVLDERLPPGRIH